MAVIQASIRRTDHAVMQFGVSIGERDDSDIVELTAAQADALRAAYSVPHGNVYIAAGVVTSDPPPPPAPPTAEDLSFNTDRQVLVDFATNANVDAFLAAATGTATAAQRDAVTKLVIADLRAMARAIRYLVRRDLI